MFLLKRIFLYLLPFGLLLYGGDKLDNLFWGHPKHDASTEMMCYCVALVITVVAVPWMTTVSDKKLKKHQELIAELLGNLRTSLNEDLEHRLKVQNLDLNIRIFSPKKTIKSRLHKQTLFVLNDHPSLRVHPMPKLTFRVSPNSEGVIGKVFESKKIVYDYDLNQQRSEEIYNLNPSQNEATAETQIVIAVPIFKEGSSDKIAAIVAFDSKKSINLHENPEWQVPVRTSCKMLHKCLPFICKND